MELFKIDAEMVTTMRNMDDEDLTAFITLQEDPESGTPIELFILAQFLLFVKNESMEHLDQACRQAGEWVEATAETDPDRARRIEILDTMAVRKLQYTDLASDSDLVNLARLVQF